MSSERVWWYDAMGCDSSDKACLTAWKTIHISALIASFLSSMASIFIIVTGIIYHKQLSNLSFGAKLPIFISICDLSFEIFHGGDHLHNILNGYVSENGLCLLFGSMKPFWINCQTAWTLAVSIYLNRNIFNESGLEPQFGGKYNIYLHIFCWGIPLIITIIGFIYNVYGVEGPWCGVNNPFADILMVDIWIWLAIFCLIINYSFIIYKLQNIISLSDKNVSDGNQKIKKVIKTLGLYPIAYFFQWIAYSLYKTHIIPRTFQTVLWVVITGNSGGIFNLFLYGPLLLNQVAREKQKKSEEIISLAIVQKASSSVQSNISSAPSVGVDITQ